MYYKTVGNVEVVFQTYKISAVFACMPILIMGTGSALSGGRLQNTGINSNFLGTFVAIAFLILIYQIIGKKKTNILLNFFQIILFSSVILLSGSRSALLMVAICAYVLWVYRKPKRFIINSLLVIATVGVVLYVLLNVGFLYDLVGNRVEDLIVYVQVGEVDDNSLTARARFIETGWERFIKNPYLGYGADCFRTIAAGQYAHNNFIELLFSFGIISILYYIPFVYCVVMVVRYHKHYFSINRDLFLFSAGRICPDQSYPG